MKQILRFLFFAAIALLGVSERANAVRDTGNAGDVYVDDFVRHAQKAVDALSRGEGDILSEDDINHLKSLIETVIVRSEPQVFVYDQVLKRNIEVDAKNVEENGEFRIVMSRKRWPRAIDGKVRTGEDKMAMAVHEYAAKLKIEINTQATSARFREQLAVLERTKPVLLKEIKASGRDGLTRGEQQRLCMQYQRIYEQAYFYVYCDLDRHFWTTQDTVTRERTVSEIIGYRYYRGYASVETWRELWGITSRTYAEGTTSGREPVIGYRTETYDAVEAHDHERYGMRIFALGKIDELPFKLIRRSDRLPGSTALTYESAIDARAACLEAIITNQESTEAWKYERAKCRAVEMQNAEGASTFRYEIRSQNPLLLTAKGL